METFADKENEPAVDNFNFRAGDRLTDLCTGEKCERAITTVTDSEIQRRNEARIPQNTKSQRPGVFKNTKSQV